MLARNVSLLKKLVFDKKSGFGCGQGHKEKEMETFANIMGILLGIVITIPFWPYAMANMGIFFTFVKEGEAKIIVRGQKYVRTIFALRDHVIDEEGTIRNFDPMLDTAQTPSFWERWYGVYWVGIAPFVSVFSYPLRWTSYKPKKNEQGVTEGNKVPIVREETLSSVFIKDKVYYGRITDAETKEGVPLNIEVLATFRVVNPYKATFLIAGWVEAMIDRIAQQARVYVGTKDYMELVSKEESEPDKGLSGFLEEALAQIAEDQYGVKFVSCDILTLDPPPEYREATTRLFNAQRKAAADIVEAEAKAKVTKLQGGADAHVIKAKAKAEADSLEKRIDAFKKSPSAAKALLSAEVGKAQGIGSIAEAIGKGLGWKREE